MSVFAVYNLKGGVGKTSTVVNLAYLAAREGQRTLLWDLDPQGAASFYFRIRPRSNKTGKTLVEKRDKALQLVRGSDFEGLDLLPADFSCREMDVLLEGDARRPARRMSKLVSTLASAYDQLFIDCPTGFSHVLEGVCEAADRVLVPVIPSTLSLRTLGQIEDALGAHATDKIWPFFSMVDRRKSLHKQTCAEGGSRFLKARIPAASAVERMGVERAPLLAYDSRSAAAQGYRALWSEVRRRHAAEQG